MPGAYFGGNAISGAHFNGHDYTAAYFNGNLVWSANRIRINFAQYPNGDLEDGDWVDHGPSLIYKAAVVSGRMRLGLPDGLVGSFYLTSRARYTGAVAPGDDGYIECRAAARGDGTTLFTLNTPYRTQVFRRVSNGAFSHGVGIELAASQVGIVRRVGGTDSVVKACGSFAAGDRIRLNQTGDLHELYVNGRFRDAWPDVGASAQKGAGYRSIGARVDASKDPLGPRRFSPSLDYIECG